MKTRQNARLKTGGYTLLEVIVVAAIVAVIMVMLLGLATGLGNTAQVQATRANAYDEARKAMSYLSRDLRQAALGSLSAAPAPALQYRVATDVDGNGSAVDMSGNLETGTQIMVARDTDDANHDGLRNQLVRLQDGQVFVLANHLEPDEDANGNNLLDSGEDTNGNGQLDHGIWFDRPGSAVRVTIQARNISNQNRVTVFTLTQTLCPRN